MTAESGVAHVEGKSATVIPLVALAAGIALAIVLAFTLKAPQRLAALIVPRHAVHRLDGRVEPGEYRFRWTDKASQLEFSWSIQGDRLIGAVSSPDTGWVAVGFGGAGPLMFGADIVMGYVDGRGAHVEDHYANSPTGQVPDTTIGGKNDILGSAGTQTAAGTTIEFERPLAAHDSLDKPIEAGQSHVIVASAQSDDLAAYHSGGRKAVALLDLFNGPPAAARESLLPDHISDVQIMLATWMTLFLLIAVHGLAMNWASQDLTPSAQPSDVSAAAVALLGVAVVVELAALAVFGVGVVLSARVWVLGASLTVGLLALTAIIVLYSRAFVRWEVIRSERDDGVPW
jgi:hypothetical protein